MQTPHRWFGAGHSTAADATEAGTEAAASAHDGRAPKAVFVFASDRYDLPALLAAVREEMGPATAIVGATAMGELSYDHAGSNGVAIAALGGPGFTVRTAVGHVTDGGHRDAGAAAAEAMTGVDSEYTALILLAGGLAGNLHEIVRGAYSVTGATIPLVGGFAAGTAGFTRTFQFVDDAVHEDAVVGLALGSDAPIGIGIAHGWHRVEPPMIVTRSQDGVIRELDDEPALDVLLRRAGLPGGKAVEVFDGRSTMMALGLSRRNGEDIRVMHGGDDETRSVFSTADVPQGALCWVMDGDDTALIEGAKQSCAEAVERLNGRPPLGAIAFDCAGRRVVIGEDGLPHEMEAMKSVLGSAPYAGFYTLGEIARTRGALGMHQLTLVTLALA